MLNISIPGFGELTLSHLLLDYNGTLAVDGYLIKDVASRLVTLEKKLQLHVLTGDTYGKARSELSGIDCKLTILSTEDQQTAKLNYIRQLSPQNTIAIGNGRNDQLMLKEAAIGIAVLGEEGAAVETITAADIAVPHIFYALDLLINLPRLVATLRY